MLAVAIASGRVAVASLFTVEMERSVQPPPVAAVRLGPSGCNQVSSHGRQGDSQFTRTQEEIPEFVPHDVATVRSCKWEGQSPSHPPAYERPGYKMTASNDRHPRCFGVTVKTPAGFASAFGASPDTAGSELAHRAVDYFVARDQLEPGPFKLAIIRDCDPIPIDSDKDLGAYDVVEGDVLHLISGRPYVDGAQR